MKIRLTKQFKDIEAYENKINKIKEENDNMIKKMIEKKLKRLITKSKENLPYIKPCPFCGSEAILLARDLDDKQTTLITSDTGEKINSDIKVYSLVIKCTKCGAEKETDTIYGSNNKVVNKAAIQKSIKEWNTRIKEEEIIDAEFKEKEKEK